MFEIFTKKRSYFDYASTTPLDPRVFKAMKPYLETKFENPSSLYKEGVVTRKAMEDSRRKVANILQVKPEEIVFTGGGTESNNMAILGVYHYYKNVLKKEKVHFVTTSIEHSSVLQTFEYIRGLGAKVTYISPEENGIIDAKKVEEALRPETVLVSVMYVNNEIGTVQPIREIGKLLKNKKENGQEILFHVDACQGALYLPLLMHDINADILTLDGSKIYGPKGTGVLFVKGGVPAGKLSPIIFGGGQEYGLRSGTENVAGIVGFAEALSIAHKEKQKETSRLLKLRDFIFTELQKKVKNIKVNGDLEKRIANNINMCVPRLDAEYAVLRMDVLGLMISSVTSCKTLSEDSSSYVIEELYKDESCSRSSLRITLGRFTTLSEVKKLIKALMTVLP